MSENRIPARPDPSPQPIQVRVFRVEPGTASTVRTLSPLYGGLFVHHVKGRSRYCDPQGCPHCQHKVEREWKGYFAGERFQAQGRLWMPCVVELTKACELDMRGVYARGQVWTMKRDKIDKGRHPPVVAELQGTLPPAALPPWFDYRGVLMHLYNVAAIDVSAANPMPPRLLLAASPHDDGSKLLKPGERAAAAPEAETFRVNGHCRTESEN